MINKLIEGIFYIINKIFTIIFTPFFSALFALFPGLTTYYNSIILFLNNALSYVSFFKASLFIPDTFFVGLFDFFIIKYSIFLLAQGVKFIINVYNKLKP